MREFLRQVVPVHREMEFWTLKIRHFSAPNNCRKQSFLNLFILWHNMRVFEKRAKRAGKSPFQWAGIDLGESDWLNLLGFLATNKV